MSEKIKVFNCGSEGIKDPRPKQLEVPNGYGKSLWKAAVEGLKDKEEMKGFLGAVPTLVGMSLSSSTARLEPMLLGITASTLYYARGALKKAYEYGAQKISTGAERRLRDDALEFTVNGQKQQKKERSNVKKIADAVLYNMFSSHKGK